MAVPEQIKETTVTKVNINQGDFGEVALAADPDRILLIIHNEGSVAWRLAINSTAPVSVDTMVEYAGSTKQVYFTTHVPTSTVYIYYTGGTDPQPFYIEHASRSSTT